MKNEQSVKIKVLGIPVYSRKVAGDGRVAALERRVADLEMRAIEESGFWDPLWYVKTYGHAFNRQQALEYWYREGWRKGENPSARFDVSQGKALCGDRNPLLAYLGPQLVFPPSAANPHRGADDARRIEAFRARQAGRRATRVVYTCITGGYDDLDEIAVYGYVDPECDYVCFTDDAALVARGRVGIWDVRPLAGPALDLPRGNRWHKMNPHLLFPEYEDSVYVDANFTILTPRLFEFIRAIDRSFALPRHFHNLCVYDEYDAVLALGRDDPAVVRAQRELLERDGMPRNYGLGENNILYRRHHEAEVVDVDEAWWSVVRDRSRRDQLSLAWLFWKRGWRFEDRTFENARLLWRDFHFFRHRAPRA